MEFFRGKTLIFKEFFRGEQRFHGIFREKSTFSIISSGGVANGKIRALPRRRDPSLKIRARDLALQKSEPETK